MKIAYIQHGNIGGPYKTVMADGVQVDANSRKNPYATGYGRKVPTRYKVLYRGRWYRVYCMVYANSGTEYIVFNKTETKVEII
jgi:hypothetical protein